MLGSTLRRVLSVLAAALVATAAPAVLSPPAALSAPGYFPYEWATPSARVGAYVSDGGGSGINPAASYVTLDGVRQETAYAQGALFAVVNGMATGPHDAAIHVEDRAGNALDFSWAFAVDAEPPTVTAQAPTGTIADSSPELRARIVDAASGIDEREISLSLERSVDAGFFTHTDLSGLRHGYDAEAGEVWYQIPERPRGLSAGSRPLLDGEYTVHLSISDRAGHTTQWTWGFTVDTLGEVLPLR